MSFSGPESHIAFRCHVSLVSLHLDNSLFLSFTNLKNTGSLFCRMSLILTLSKICSVYAFMANDAMSLSLHHIKRHLILLFSSLVTLMSITWSDFPTSRLTIFPFVINKYVVGEMLSEYINTLFRIISFIQHSPINFSIHWCLPNSDILFLSFFLHLLIGILLWGRDFSLAMQTPGFLFYSMGYYVSLSILFFSL